MQVFTRQDLERFVDHENTYAAVEKALRRLAAGQVAAPNEIALHAKPSGEVHVKGAHIEGSDWIVFKVASGSFPDAANAGCSIVLSAVSGEPVALFDDGGWLTEMRTAAAGAIAANALANPGPLDVAILGTGAQARFQLQALRVHRTINTVRIWGRSRSRADQLADEVGATAFDQVAQAVESADLIVTTTSATSPILKGTDLPAGVHITAMGADTVGKRELGADVLSAAAVIAADDLPTCAQVGELQHSPTDAARASALASIVAGHATGRTSPGEITVADLCGIGTYDAAIAGLAAELLK